MIQLADLVYGARDDDGMRELSDAHTVIRFAPAQRAASYDHAVLTLSTIEEI